MIDDLEAGDEDSPNADLYSWSSSSSNTVSNSAQSDTGSYGEASLSSTTTKEINISVLAPKWLGSSTVANRAFKECNRQYDVHFVYQLNP